MIKFYGIETYEEFSNITLRVKVFIYKFTSPEQAEKYIETLDKNFTYVVFEWGE